MRNPVSVFFFWFLVSFSPAPLVGFGTYYLVHSKEASPPPIVVAPPAYGAPLEWVPGAQTEQELDYEPTPEPAPEQPPQQDLEPDFAAPQGPYQRKQMDAPKSRNERGRPDV